MLDADSGDTLLRLPAADGAPYTSLSPDGKYVERVIQDYDPGQDPPAELVYDVATGGSIEVPGDRGWGWTPDGDLFAVAEDGTLTTCDPATGDCTDQHVDLPAPPKGEDFLDVILGGTIRES